MGGQHRRNLHPIDCGKQILDKAGFEDYKYLRVTDLGFKKGHTPINEEVIKKVYDTAVIIY